MKLVSLPFMLSNTGSPLLCMLYLSILCSYFVYTPVFISLGEIHFILTSFLSENNFSSCLSLAHHQCDWANFNTVWHKGH